MMGFTCDKCGAKGEGAHDGYGGENAPKGWVQIQTAPLHVSRVCGSRSGTTFETLCPACNVPGFWGRAAARASARLERIATAFDPVREWYEGEGDRPLAEMLTDAIADLQRDRAGVAKWAAFADLIGFDCPDTPEAFAAKLDASRKAEKLLGEILEADRLVREFGPGHEFDLRQRLDVARQAVRDKSAEFAEAYGLGDALTRIRAERTRQVTEEGWDAEHDDQHNDDSLAFAACNYAMPERCRSFVARVWPWDATWWKPTPGDRVRELVKAGALIVAEIDRIRRGIAAERERERQARFDGRHG